MYIHIHINNIILICICIPTYIYLYIKVYSYLIKCPFWVFWSDLLRFNLHTIKFTLLMYTVRWVLTNVKCQTGTINVMQLPPEERYRIFPSCQKVLQFLLLVISCPVLSMTITRVFPCHNGVLQDAALCVAHHQVFEIHSCCLDPSVDCSFLKNIYLFKSSLHPAWGSNPQSWDQEPCAPMDWASQAPQELAPFHCRECPFHSVTGSQACSLPFRRLPRGRCHGYVTFLMDAVHFI